MSKLLALALVLLVPFAHAEAPFEPALTVIRYCEFLNERMTNVYAKFTEDKRPPKWQIWAQDDFETGAKSLSDFLARSRKMAGFDVLAQHLGEGAADSTRQDCLKRKVEWSELMSRFSGLGGMSELAQVNIKMGGSFSPAFKAEVQRQTAISREAALARQYDEKSKTVLELGRHKLHVVTISVSIARCLSPLSLGTGYFDREAELWVPGGIYNQLPVGEIEPGWSWHTVTPLAGSDERGPCRISVQNRRIEISHYILNDQEKIVRISESEWNLYVAAFKRRSVKLAESNVGDHHKIVVVKSDSAKTYDRPLKHYFVTLRPAPRELGQLFQEYESPFLKSTLEFEFSDLDMRLADSRPAVGRRLRDFLVEPSGVSRFDDTIVGLRTVDDQQLVIDSNQFVHRR